MSQQYQQGVFYGQGMMGQMSDGIDQEFVIWKCPGANQQMQWNEQPGERAAFRAGYEAGMRRAKGL